MQLLKNMHVPKSTYISVLVQNIEQLYSQIVESSSLVSVLFREAKTNEDQKEP